MIGKLKSSLYVFKTIIPKRIFKKECNICGWVGTCFIDSPEGPNMACPRCKSVNRHRHFVEYINNNFSKREYPLWNVLEVARSFTTSTLSSKFPHLTVIDKYIDESEEKDKVKEMYGDVTNLKYQDNGHIVETKNQKERPQHD